MIILKILGNEFPSNTHNVVMNQRKNINIFSLSLREKFDPFELKSYYYLHFEIT